jgi:hypothetical protein
MDPYKTSKEKFDQSYETQLSSEKIRKKANCGSKAQSIGV